MFNVQLHCQIGNNNIQFYRKLVEMLKKIMQSQPQQSTKLGTFV